MRPALGCALLLSACAGVDLPLLSARPAVPPLASVPAQVWRGALRCSPLAGAASQSLALPIELIVSGETARYRRADEAAEAGEGTVAPDGSLTLTGRAVASAGMYTAQYSGMLRPDGGPSRLSGHQVWDPAHANPASRSCSMMLRREG